MPLWLLAIATSSADERRFTYVYETFTPEEDEKEIEPWVTFVPQGDGNLELQHRVELEVPITDRLSTSYYLNWHESLDGFEFEGVANEWKLNLMERDEEPIGLALYGEWGLGPAATSVEGKVLVDREMGGLVLAYNFTTELELQRTLGFSAGDSTLTTVRELAVENALGAAYRFGETASLGLEGQAVTEFVNGALRDTTLQAGPAIGLTTEEEAWTALTVLPTLATLGPEVEPLVFPSDTDTTPLSVEVRWLAGVSF